MRGTVDIVFAYSHVKASLSGLGVLGAGIHSEEESMHLKSISRLVKRTAVLLYRLKGFKL